MRVFPPLLIASALFVATLHAEATCYTVYDKPGKIIFQSTEPPVDLSRDLHNTVPVRFGSGTSMIFDTNPNTSCPGIGAGTDPSTGATTGYMAGVTSATRAVNAAYIRSDRDNRPSSSVPDGAMVNSTTGSSASGGFGNPTGAFTGLGR